MEKSILKVRSSPARHIGQVTEELALPLHYYLIVSVFSTNRAILSHGGLKPNFIKNEKRNSKKPPLLKKEA